jgi:hypothetical protein
VDLLAKQSCSLEIIDARLRGQIGSGTCSGRPATCKSAAWPCSRGRAEEGGAREVARSRAPQIPAVDGLLPRHQRQKRQRREKWIEVLPFHRPHIGTASHRPMKEPLVVLVKVAAADHIDQLAVGLGQVHP